jgi:hypothetical protein
MILILQTSYNLYSIRLFKISLKAHIGETCFSISWYGGGGGHSSSSSSSSNISGVL